MVNKILRLPQVKEATGLSRSAIYLAMKEGTFPQSIQLSKRAIGWDAKKIQAWIDKRIADAEKENI